MMTMTRQPQLEKYIRERLKDHYHQPDVDRAISHIASLGTLQTTETVEPFIQSVKNIDVPIGLLELRNKNFMKYPQL